LNVLVTGAAGFLGRHVVAALLARGHRVRVLVRPATSIDGLSWADRVEVFRADLRSPRPLEGALEEIDVLVHLAARVGGSDAAQMADTVVGTERLLEAMARSATRRLVLASSFSVYDWGAVRGGVLTEESPLAAADLYRRDGYTIAKTWQERVARRMSRDHGWDLTVLRPGFIWGKDHADFAGLGQKVGRWYVVIAPAACAPLTHVENCADAFAEAVEDPRAAGETFNVVDNHGLSSWRYLGEYRRRTGARLIRIPVPYAAWLTGALMASAVSRRLFGEKAKLPGLFVPCRFRARFRPLRFDTRKIHDILGWSPPLDLESCLRRTYERTPPDPPFVRGGHEQAGPPQFSPPYEGGVGGGPLGESFARGQANC
jgi:2-alkyl-3-oxoalkanoate reductase